VGDGAERAATSRIPANAAETLYHAFEGLGLTPYQARVVVALQQAGSSNCLDLARLAGIPRTSTYQVLDELDGKGLASRLPGNGPAIWASVGRQEALDRLVALEAERLDKVKANAARVSEMLERLLPADQSVSPPYVQVIHDPSRVGQLYQQLLSRTEEELLVFNRPPYTRQIGVVDPLIVDTVARASARVLYQSAQAEDAEYEIWHDEMDRYHQAGVEGRVVDALPIKMAIFDRQSSLVTLDDPVLPQIGFPISLFIDHPGYSSVQASAFEALWATATAYEQVHAQQAAYRSTSA
jgi:sugar-specific transcriptional regulator TrmB